MRSEPWPLLYLEVDSPNIDVARYVNVEPEARSVREVTSGRRIGEAAGLRSETSQAKHELGISIDLFITIDIAWAREVGVLTDVRRRPHVVVNLAFHPKVIQEIEVAPESQAFDIALSVIRVGNHSADTCL